MKLSLLCAESLGGRGGGEEMKESLSEIFFVDEEGREVTLLEYG